MQVRAEKNGALKVAAQGLRKIQAGKTKWIPFGCVGPSGLNCEYLNSSADCNDEGHGRYNHFQGC